MPDNKHHHNNSHNGLLSPSSASNNSNSRLFAADDKTMRARRHFPFMQHPTLQRDQLRKYHAETMGGGRSAKLAVELPPGHPRNEWLAINTVDFYNQLNLVYGCISEFCTKESCPQMSAGKKYEYLLWPDAKHPKPYACSAPEYAQKLLEWIESQLDDQRLFPVNGEFPDDFESATIRTIFKRMFRIYAHIVHAHLSTLEELNEQRHFNSCFKHFWMFCKEFDLVDAQEQRPLLHVIQQLDAKQGQQ